MSANVLLNSGVSLMERHSRLDDAAGAEQPVQECSFSSTVSASAPMSAYRRARTISRLPRPRKANIHEKDVVGVTADETFWNILFSNAFGPGAVGHFFINNNYWFGSIYLLCFYSTFAASAGYAARFNDKDVLHQVLWVVHGLLLAGMLARTGDVQSSIMNEAGIVTFKWFCICCAATKLLIALMYARAAFHLPVARRACLMYFVVLGSQALMLVSVTFWLTEHNARKRVWVVLPLLALEVGNAPEFLFAKLRCGGRQIVTPITISIEYMTARSNSLVVMLLGLMIVQVVTQCRQWGEVSLRDCWSVAVSDIIFSVSMNILFYQASDVDFELHALSNTAATAWLWFFAQLMFVAATSVTSAGFADHLQECGDDSKHESEYADEKSCYGALAMFFVIFLLDFIHDTPCRVCRRRQLDRGRGDHCCGYMSRPRQARIISHILGMMIPAAAHNYVPEYMMAPTLAADALLLVVVFGLAKRLRQRRRDRISRREIDTFQPSNFAGSMQESIGEEEEYGDVVQA